MSVLFRLLQALGKVGLAFVPPTDDLNLSTKAGIAARDWRTLMAAALTGLTWGFVLHTVWACGLLVYIGVQGTGFARAADTNRILAAQISAQIYERKKDYCAAPNGSRAKQQHWDALTRLREEYEGLQHERYNEPGCDEL